MVISKLMPTPHWGVLLTCLFTTLLAQAMTSCAWAQRGVELVAETNRPRTSTYSVGEPVIASFFVAGLQAGQTTELNVEIRNEFGVIVADYEPFTLTATALGRAKLELKLPSQRLGYYEIRGQLSNGTTFPKVGSRPAGIVTYAVVPDPTERAVFPASKTRFGLQGGFNAKAVVLPYLGARWRIRGSLNWAKMEPEYPGQFFAKSRVLSHIRDGTYPLIFKGKRWETYFLATVTRSKLPRWARKNGTQGTISKNFGALSALGVKALPSFAFEMAKRFARDFPGQDIRYYQVTWEPNSGWGFRGTPEELVDIYRLVYGSIHEADSRASVTGPTIHLDPASSKQLSELWEAGLARYIDAFSSHPKPKWPPEENELPEVLRAQMREAENAAGHKISFLGTEQGYRSNVVGLLGKALGDIRSSVITLGEGAQLNFGFYAHDFGSEDDPSQDFSQGFYWNLNPKRYRFGTDKLGPKPVVPAYAAMTLFLDGTVSEGPIEGLTGTQMGYRFSRHDQTIAVVWDYTTKSEYVVPEGQTVCDWMGNCDVAGKNSRTLNGSPIYVYEK